MLLQSRSSFQSIPSDVISIVDTFSCFELAKGGRVSWEMKGFGERSFADESYDINCRNSAVYNNMLVHFHGHSNSCVHLFINQKLQRQIQLDRVWNRKYIRLYFFFGLIYVEKYDDVRFLKISVFETSGKLLRDLVIGVNNSFTSDFYADTDGSLFIIDGNLLKFFNVTNGKIETINTVDFISPCCKIYVNETNIYVYGQYTEKHKSKQVHVFHKQGRFVHAFDFDVPAFFIRQLCTTILGDLVVVCNTGKIRVSDNHGKFIRQICNNPEGCDFVHITNTGKVVTTTTSSFICYE